MSRLFVVLALFAVSGCSESRRLPSPVAPSATAPASPTVSRQSLYGYVANTAFRAVAGAKIEVVDGPQAGTSILSDSGGLFSYAGDFATPVTMRVSRDGYMTATATSRVSAPGGRPWVYARLESVVPPANIAGEYMLTLTADRSCTGIPADWRTRSYSATITPLADPTLRPNTLLTLAASGAEFLPGHDAFQIGVSGDEAGFDIYQGEEFGLVDQVAPGTFLAFGGSAFGPVGESSGSAIAARLDGVIEYCVLQTYSWKYDCRTSGAGLAYATCPSANHQLTLTRR
jgi:hypothetical protein